MTAHEDATAPPAHNVPEKKRTALGLYVTSAEAYEMWKADPDRVTIVDVRTPEEYIFVGHAPMARNIPIGFITYQWDAEKDEPAFVVNSEFMPRDDGAVRADRHASTHVPVRRPQRTRGQRARARRASRTSTTSSTASRATRSPRRAASTWANA